MQITIAHAAMLFYSAQVVLGFFNLGRSTRVVQFYRGDDGKIMNDGAQSDDSQLSDEQAVITMKFPGEVRMSLGCAAVQKVGSTEPEGVRAEMFDYSDHNLITIKRGRELKKMADAAAMRPEAATTSTRMRSRCRCSRCLLCAAPSAAAVVPPRQSPTVQWAPSRSKCR